MLRAPAPVRAAAALVGIGAAFTLAGCAGTEAATTADTADDTTTSTTDESTTTDSSGTGEYVDGTYTAEGSYATPESVESITVTLTIADDTVTAVEVTGEPQARETEQYQSAFVGGIADVVVGESVDEVSVSRVAGSSLTSTGFMQALETIKAEAAA
ncbi:hypothetical protein GCM10009808_13720 [Microbacterium sediminicola]|uniref:FMN-binding domain-containing protein n=1 Tax=Microbacterium sediminicola TaxID=415210 RepID=A0ABP4U1R1_9MICO